MNRAPYLLDTHVIIWIFEDSSRLSPTVTAAVEYGLNAAHRGELAVSVASYWEVAIKSRKKTMGITDPVAWWDRVVNGLDASVLSIRPAHVAAVTALEDHHADPFDRILVAQAIAENFTLITKDPLIQRYPVQTLW